MSREAFSRIGKWVLLLAVLVTGLQSSGQPYFSRIYEGFGFSGATIAPDSGLVLCSGSSLLRLDREGTPLWATSYSTSTGGNVTIRDVAWMGDSSFVYVGRELNAAGTGNAMAQHVVSGSGVPVWGGQLNFFNTDELLKAERSPDGSAVVCGYNWGLSQTYGYAVRLGPAPGSYTTPLRTSPSASPNVAVIVDVLPTSDGGFIGVGYDVGLLVAYKVNASGSIAWSRSMPIGGLDLLSMHAVEGDALSTYLATQTFDDFFRLIRLGPNGAVAWCKTYGMPGNDRPTGMVRFANGDLWISGVSWLMACSAVGDVLWARSIPHQATGMEATLEGDGVFLFGVSGNDGWVMRTDMSGQVAGCSDSTFAPIVGTETVVATPDGPPVETTSLFNDSVIVATGVIPVSTTDCLVTALAAGQTVEVAMRAYPIPFTDQLSVELTFPHDRVELIDAHGAIRCSMRTRAERSVVLPRGDLSQGLYLLRVLHANTPVAVQRVIVE